MTKYFQELKKHDQTLMCWVKELSTVEEASRVSESEVLSDFKNFQTKVHQLKKSIDKEADKPLRKGMESFFKVRLLTSIVYLIF